MLNHSVSPSLLILVASSKVNTQDSVLFQDSLQTVLWSFDHSLQDWHFVTSPFFNDNATTKGEVCLTHISVLCSSVWRFLPTWCSSCQIHYSLRLLMMMVMMLKRNQLYMLTLNALWLGHLHRIVLRTGNTCPLLSIFILTGWFHC